jgi:hypothetical protein
VLGAEAYRGFSVTTIAITSAAATAASSSTASSSTAPGINPFYTQTFSPQPPQPRQESLLRILQWHQEEEKRHEEEKKAARIAEFRERFEKAMGFDEEDDEEFYPGVGEGKGKGKERG